MGEIGAGCLDEDEVMAFVAGDLPSQRRDSVMAHVDGCDTCRSLAAALAHEQTPDDERREADEAPAPASLSSGELIEGRFRLDKPLGKGAMGTVFRAHDERLGTDVALKLVKRDGDARSFARELQAGRRVTHPNVCRVYDAGSIEGYDYITMELIEGETLAELIMREDLAPKRAHAVVDGIAGGLAAAHAQGIVHRDLKPANVMVERGTERVVLTDFGVATDLAAGQSYRLVGTPQYWPPEQARGEPARAASDVYSLGVVAYRILSGRDLKLNEDEALANVPRAFRSVIARCIEHRPSDRYKDAAIAREAFASAARGSQRVIGKRGLAMIATLAVAGVVVYRFGFANETAVRPEPSASTVSPPLPVVTAAASVASEAPTASAPSTIAVPPSAASSAPVIAARPARPAASVSARTAASTAASAKPPPGDILYVK